ncbi:hypothetical protein N9F54_01705 [Actinomycetota bacterium]|nr:hypothetical protein [Actinomycetota bacterium]
MPNPTWSKIVFGRTYSRTYTERGGVTRTGLNLIARSGQIATLDWRTYAAM